MVLFFISRVWLTGGRKTQWSLKTGFNVYNNGFKTNIQKNVTEVTTQHKSSLVEFSLVSGICVVCLAGTVR